jgi:outer membrane protein TolC
MKEQSTTGYPPLKRFSRIIIAALGVTSAGLAFSPAACAQMGGASGASQQPNAPSASASSAAGRMDSGPQGGGYSSSQNPYMGSVPEGTATSQVLPLTFKEAIDRGLRNNLGILLVSDSTLAARGEKWKELGALLPNVSGTVSENVNRINLATLGFRFSSPAFAGIPSVVGPFGYFDARLNFSQTLFDWNAWKRERGASENEKATEYSYKNARELVVLAVGNAYLEALAGAARVDTSEAEVNTAQALFNKAEDQQKAGVAPAIDTLRSQVELQTRRQQLIVARNTFAKQKLSLARAIGLPPGQEFSLVEKEPYQPLVPMPVDEALQRAYTHRSDFLAAQQQVKAAELFRHAATAEHLPTLGIEGNYGDSSVTPGNPETVYQLAATLKIPIFTGNKSHADALQAEATLRQDKQQMENLRGQIDYEVRTALLDLQAAADQVEVAQNSVDLANQTLTQARDRFAAGVADNLEVVQAQESLASANENYIAGLYAHNVAKVELARAIGYAEEGVKQYLMNHGP